MRLDQHLAQTYPQFSRHKLTQAIKDGLVRVNGDLVDPDLEVSDDAQIEFNPEELVESPATAEQIDLNVIFKNDDFLVLDKPAGMVVHPGVGHQTGTVLNALLNIQEEDALDRAGIVHRLDKDTSGLMIVAKNVKTQKKLVSLFKERLIHKEYLGLVRGKMDQPAGEINESLGRDQKNPLKFAVQADGKEAVTRYFSERVLPEHTLLRLLPLTGRTHQLRVHLSFIHHPIYGDSLYGGEAGPRLFLHATKLDFRLNDKEWSFESPLPKDLEGILTQFAGFNSSL